MAAVRSVCLISREYPPDTAFGGIARVVEMQARRGGRDGAGGTRIDRLVTRFVRVFGFVLDVRRQRHGTFAIQRGEHVVAMLETQSREAAAALEPGRRVTLTWPAEHAYVLAGAVSSEA